MVQWSHQRFAVHVRAVEASVQIVHQLVANSESVHRGFGHFGVAFRGVVARILVLGIVRVMRSTKGVVGAQLEPPATQRRRGIVVESTNVSTGLEVKNSSIATVPLLGYHLHSSFQTD